MTLFFSPCIDGDGEGGQQQLQDGAGSGVPAPCALKWLKFDDEFVHPLPAGNLHTTVVSGESFAYVLVDCCDVRITWLLPQSQ
jgi:hypothetical protein